MQLGDAAAANTANAQSATLKADNFSEVPQASILKGQLEVDALGIAVTEGRISVDGFEPQLLTRAEQSVRLAVGACIEGDYGQAGILAAEASNDMEQALQSASANFAKQEVIGVDSVSSQGPPLQPAAARLKAAEKHFSTAATQLASVNLQLTKANATNIRATEEEVLGKGAGIVGSILAAALPATDIVHRHKRRSR